MYDLMIDQTLINAFYDVIKSWVKFELLQCFKNWKTVQILIFFSYSRRSHQGFNLKKPLILHFRQSISCTFLRILGTLFSLHICERWVERECARLFRDWWWQLVALPIRFGCEQWKYKKVEFRFENCLSCCYYTITIPTSIP